MKPHDRNQSRAYCCDRYGHHGEPRRRAELSHDAACDWLANNPIPCGVGPEGIEKHLKLCQQAVAERCGFVDPGTIMLAWNVITLLWSFLEWWFGGEDE